MQTDRFRAWLVRRPIKSSTVRTYVTDDKRIECCYGDLDTLYENDRLAAVIESLEYSAEDARKNAPNPSKIQTTLAALSGYNTAAKQYRDYRDNRIPS